MALAAWEGFWFTDFIRDIYRYLTIYSLSIFVSLILLTWAYILAQFLEVGIVFFFSYFLYCIYFAFFLFCCFFCCCCCFYCCCFFSEQGAIKSKKYFKTDNFFAQKIPASCPIFFTKQSKKREGHTIH